MGRKSSESEGTLLTISPSEEPTIGSSAQGGEDRADRNREAIEYYRLRSRAPGVAEGGGPRNYYCMQCDGVIPHDQTICPHCGDEAEGGTRRYFNWVEIDAPPQSDLRALSLLALGAVLVLAVLGLVLWSILR